MQQSIKILKEQLQLEFKEHKDSTYQDNFNDNEYYQLLTDNYEQYLKSVEIDHIDIKWLADLSLLHYEYSTYSLEALNDEAKSKHHLNLSIQYGNLCLEYGSQACGCFDGKNPFIIQNKAVFMLSNILLLGDIEQFNSISKHLIDSLNGKSCIIKKGYKNSTISWFLLQLYSIYSNHEITLHKLLKPKDIYPFDDILKDWDTDDINDVSKYIELLCDFHLIQASLDYEIHYKEQFSDNDDERDVFGMKYKELFSVNTYALPFEILTWLKLRELRGLKNPKEFSHPLMNTDLTKMYLDMKEPLQTPSEVPYVNELIAKLKKECLDKKEVKTVSIAKNDTTPLKGLAPKTGRYRATLPNEHRQANQLEGDPHSYARFKKDDTFTYEGLEDYDLSEITWSYLGE